MSVHLTPGSLTGQRIAFLNWRDFAHPQAGGAELYCHSMAERFSRAGAEVTLVTSRPSGLKRRDDVGGVHIRRGGGTFGVYVFALLWLLVHRRRVDAVIDCQNGIPFFSPLAVSRRTAVVCVIHHVHQEQFRREFAWPLSAIGRVLEGTVSRWVYGRMPFATVSPSTRTEVRRRLRLRGPLHVVPNGMDRPVVADEWNKSAAPRIGCVGRMVAHKRFELLLRALPDVLREVPELLVDMVGDGPEREALEREATALGLQDVVRFHGRVSDEERDRIQQAAWVTVNPSHHEGWGLSVLEANAHGVPAIAFRVPGLHDALRDGETGWLLEDGAALAPTIVAALTELGDRRARAIWADRCRSWAAGFDWDRSADRLAGLFLTEIDHAARGRRRERRRSTDLAVRVSLATPADREALARWRRRTDVWDVTDKGASGLLYGADERDALRVLERLGHQGPSWVQAEIARPIDLLVSPAEGPVLR